MGPSPPGRDQACPPCPFRGTGRTPRLQTLADELSPSGPWFHFLVKMVVLVSVFHSILDVFHSLHSQGPWQVSATVSIFKQKTGKNWL